MFTIVRPIWTKSIENPGTLDIHLVSFCEADTDLLPENTPLLFIYHNEQADPVIITVGKLIKGIGKYYQIFASTDPKLGVPPMSNSFVKKIDKNNEDMSEVLMLWENQDGKWTPFVHPRKGHVIINSVLNPPQVGQTVCFPGDPYGGFHNIIDIIKYDDENVDPYHKYGVKFDNPSDFLDYRQCINYSKSFHP